MDLSPAIENQETTKEEELIKLRRTIGYFSGVNFIVGSIVGSGIFISPGGVLAYSCLNVGIALTIWAVCGLLSMLGALCYAELGSSLPSSGGEYYYIKRGLGSIPAFIFLWTLTVFIKPASIAAKALTFAEYAIQPFYPGCFAPELAKKSTAIAAVIILGTVNALSVKWATWIQNVFTVLKIIALAIIVIGGLVLLILGRTENLMNAFVGGVPNVSQIGEAFYQGIFAYGGWNVLNYVTEELKNPSKNIPRCIMIAVPCVIVFFLLVNISYLTVMTPREMMSSAGVAITWADRVIGSCSWIIPISVAISTFGSINGSTFSQSRLNYAASREGHMPPIMSMLHVHHLTPAPAIIFSTAISVVLVIPSNLLMLINYFGFATWLLVGLTCISLIVLRYREPTLHRPYKVFLPFPFLMVAVSVFLTLAPIIQSPQMEYIYALVFMAAGLFFYFPFVYFKAHFEFFDKITCYLQLLLEVIPSVTFNDSKRSTA
ncbi:b(0,+)-type amino acid transporter 1-like [Latimeria chalumnae]|uniref:b(0,+)-type amino acid transporter 1-like n=1 Tax=Latimeria chalumnae TaxID=7897 RepID=UPI00313ECAD3